MTTNAAANQSIEPVVAQPVVLSVRNLQTQFKVRRSAPLMAVDDVSFDVARGRILGIVGESGSGKSVTGFSIIGLVDPPGEVVGGSVHLDGIDLVLLGKEELRKLRGNRIAMIFQDPMTSLNPVLTIGTQMRETLAAHSTHSRAAATQLCVDALSAVGIPAALSRLDAYPHEFSGGMRQRVAIAMALLHKPALIIADEPTTALDVTIQSQIVSQVQALAREHGTAVIWISHDLSVVSGLADEVAVMYAGQVVERGPVDQILAAPAHPYTRGLIACLPDPSRRGGLLAQIPGMPPTLDALPQGCRFRPRCGVATEICLTSPNLSVLGQDHFVRCHHPQGRPCSTQTPT